MTALRCGVAPIRCDGTNDDAIAGLETANLGADLMHDADGLVPQSKVLPRPDRPSDRMRIGSANKRHRCLYDGIHRARPRHRLLSKPNLPDCLHHERLHGCLLSAAASPRFYPLAVFDARISVWPGAAQFEDVHLGIPNSSD